MRRGTEAIALPVIMGLVLVIIVGMVAFGGLKVAAGLVNYIDALLRGRPNVSVQNVVNAITCAYERCKSGCSKIAPGQIAIIQVDGSEKDCAMDFCKPEYTDAAGMVCDQLARDHPVVAAFTESGSRLGTYELSGAISKCPGDAQVCAVGAVKDDSGELNDIGSGNEVNMHWRDFAWFESSMVKSVSETSTDCGIINIKGSILSPILAKIAGIVQVVRGQGFVYASPRSCDAGNDIFSSYPSGTTCCASSFQLAKGTYYVSSFTVTSPGFFDLFTIDGEQDKVGVLSTPKTDSLSCSLLGDQPCMRMSPTNATVTVNPDGTYTVGVYLQYDANAAAGDDKLLFYSILGAKWNDPSAKAFTSGDLKSVELQTVSHDCYGLDSGTCDSVHKDGLTSKLIRYDGSNFVSVSDPNDKSTQFWGVAAFYSGDLKVSDLAGKDLRILYTFYDRTSAKGLSKPANWFSISPNGVALLVGGTFSKTIPYWSPSLDLNDNYVRFTELVKRTSNNYCTAGNDAAGAKDAFPALIADLPTKTCGRGCPVGKCQDELTSGGDIAWSGAVYMKFRPKTFVCCPSAVIGSYSWQPGTSCISGPKADEDKCSPSCAAKCTGEGYGTPIYEDCNFARDDPCYGKMNTPGCERCGVCSCNSY